MPTAPALAHQHSNGAHHSPFHPHALAHQHSTASHGLAHAHAMGRQQSSASRALAKSQSTAATKHFKLEPENSEEVLVRQSVEVLQKWQATLLRELRAVEEDIKGERPCQLLSHVVIGHVCLDACREWLLEMPCTNARSCCFLLVCSAMIRAVIG